MKRNVMSGLFLMLCTSQAMAVTHLLPEDSLICDTADKFERQTSMFAKKDFSLLPGCGLTKSAMMVELVNASLLGATEVYVSSARATIFVDRASLK